MVEEGVVDAEWAEEDWLSYDRRFQFGEPVAHAFEDVIDALQRWLRLHPKDKLLHRGLEAGVSFAPVNTIGDALAFDHLEARDFWAKAELPDGSSARAPGVFARPPAVTLRAPPKLDEHGAEIRAELASATPKPPEPKDPGEFPFSGLKVADFSWVGVGPISARYLADHGATVVRVESESRPDVLRVNGPFKHPKGSTAVSATTSGARSPWIQTPGGRHSARRSGARTGARTPRSRAPRAGWRGTTSSTLESRPGPPCARRSRRQRLCRRRAFPREWPSSLTISCETRSTPTAGSTATTSTERWGGSRTLAISSASGAMTADLADRLP